MKSTNMLLCRLLVIGTLMAAPLAHAQVAISEEGVKFPDQSEQTSAVIVPMNCPHGDSIVWDSNAESWACETDLSPPGTYAKGDTGPAGGIVFYVTDGGLHGLEAAPPPPDEDPTAEWGCIGTHIEYTRFAVGSGVTNTARILELCTTSGIAARVASDYSWPNGQADGFLPSLVELALMHANLPPATGGFADGIFWSSSEVNGDVAWLQLFDDGGLANANKNTPFTVRAVRAF